MQMIFLGSSKVSRGTVSTQLQMYFIRSKFRHECFLSFWKIIVQLTLLLFISTSGSLPIVIEKDSQNSSP